MAVGKGNSMCVLKAKGRDVVGVVADASTGEEPSGNSPAVRWARATLFPSTRPPGFRLSFLESIEHRVVERQ